MTEDQQLIAFTHFTVASDGAGLVRWQVGSSYQWCKPQNSALSRRAPSRLS